MPKRTIGERELALARFVLTFLHIGGQAAFKYVCESLDVGALIWE